VRVVRLADPPQRLWSVHLWQRSLRQWLLDRRDEYDIALVAGLGSEARAARQGCADAGRPFVLRPKDLGDVAPQSFFSRQRSVLQAAAGVLADGAAMCAALTAAGCPRERMHEIPDGVPLPPPRNRQRQAAARRELAGADAELRLAPDTPLALYAGPLDADRMLDRLIEAWRLVVEELPAARLWIVGAGPERSRLTAQIETARLGGRVLITGPFDSIEDFYQAADVFVHPGEQLRVSLALREAMAASLAVVAADTFATRKLLETEQQGRIVSAPGAAPLAQSLVELLLAPALRADLGQAARQRAEAAFCLAQVADQHLALLAQLAQAQR
jgi:glycosyltransferase involved in cell wall biosynthesis